VGEGGREGVDECIGRSQCVEHSSVKQLRKEPRQLLIKCFK
jgi:hypothetical protein